MIHYLIINIFIIGFTYKEFLREILSKNKNSEERYAGNLGNRMKDFVT